ncbi:hypothetical protein [Arenibacter troitsensis]|uniref:hypothetical protein n=1 Tax=Arenibacter troitsensis TaxID=188872 RepID=UPI00111BF546|nr:hypothetical protein [Arenibacter troitsensis]
MNNLFQLRVQSYFMGQKILTKKQLIDRILQDYPQMKISSILVYISQLKNLGILENPSKGIYTLKYKE